MLFGEYFPNPGGGVPWLRVTTISAMVVEGFGTFLLVTMIFLLTEGCNVGRPSEALAPVFVGGTVSAIIAIFAPMTQAGLNPARDLGPRIVAYLAGWGPVAIPGPRGGFFVVYVLAPLLGGIVAAMAFRLVIAPLMTAKAQTPNICACQPEMNPQDRLPMAP
jgi:glycerol uptake facilitator protein